MIRGRGPAAAGLPLLAAALILQACVVQSRDTEAPTEAAGPADAIGGTALYRERLPLPPGALFEATLQDIARADAAATILGRVSLVDPRLPIRFSIPFDPNEISARGRYAVRATIHVDGKLRFSSDTLHPVLRHEGDTEVEILLREVGSAEAGGSAGHAAEPPGLPEHGLRLPASFRGDLPCADCAAVRHHLDLWPDQVFHLRREWLGKDEPRVMGDVGRWRFDAARKVLILLGGTEMPLQFEILAANRLRLLDLTGKRIESDLPYQLESIGRLDMAEIPAFFLGHMRYLADAARLTECHTGRSYPIADGEQALQMQREYLARVASPGAELLMHFEGRLAQRPGMEGERLQPTWVVDRFIAARPDQGCPQMPPGQAELGNTYWRLQRLYGQSMTVVDNRREPHIRLRESDDERRYAATVGCNQLIGRYEVDADKLRFSPAASTLMTCPAPLAEPEAALRKLLSDTRSWQIRGSELSLEDETGAEIARLAAVHFGK